MDSHVAGALLVSSFSLPPEVPEADEPVPRVPSEGPELVGRCDLERCICSCWFLVVKMRKKFLYKANELAKPRTR